MMVVPHRHVFSYYPYVLRSVALRRLCHKDCRLSEYNVGSRWVWLGRRTGGVTGGGLADCTCVQPECQGAETEA